MSETKMSATEMEIALLRRDASWAATHRSELADLRSAFERAEKKVAAADAMAKALESIVGDHDERRKAYPNTEDQPHRLVVMADAREALAAYNALTAAADAPAAAMSATSRQENDHA